MFTFSMKIPLVIPLATDMKFIGSYDVNRKLDMNYDEKG